jgi:hypothetical protein
MPLLGDMISGGLGYYMNEAVEGRIHCLCWFLDLG